MVATQLSEFNLKSEINVKLEFSSDFIELLDYCEHNYTMLLQLFPMEWEIDEAIEINLKNNNTLGITVTESSKYTSFLTLTHGGIVSIRPSYIPQLIMQLRICHDLKVVDVLTYQNRAHTHYHVTPQEKIQTNLLLNDLLKSAISNRMS